MIDGNVSEPLRSLLEFESQRHGLPISYRRLDFRYLSLEEPFCPEVVVLVHCDDSPEQFSLPAGGVIPVRASVYADPPGEPVGPVIDGEVVPLAFVQGRRVLVPFNLERLESEVPNAINRVFDQIAELALSRAVEYVRAYDWKAEKELFAGVMTRALDQCVNKMRTDIRDNDWSVETKTNEVLELVKKNVELKEAVEAIQATGHQRRRENAFRAFAEMMKLTPQVYRTITFDDYTLSAETGPVEVDYDGFDYDLGRFRVEIGFANDSLEITNLVPDRIIEGYHHPHVNSSGSPCLGNISLSLSKLLAAKQYVPALILIHQFLCSYNEDGPYLKIQHWDLNYDGDDDEYESCYENASTSECVNCDRDGCPWWDERYDRCREFSELDRCLECKACDEVDNQIDACRESVDPEECVSCRETRCHYAGDEDACHSAHDGERCDTCNRTDCKHYPEEEEEHNAESIDAPAGA